MSKWWVLVAEIWLADWVHLCETRKFKRSSCYHVRTAVTVAVKWSYHSVKSCSFCLTALVFTWPSVPILPVWTPLPCSYHTRHWKTAISYYQYVKNLHIKSFKSEDLVRRRFHGQLALRLYLFLDAYCTRMLNFCLSNICNILLSTATEVRLIHCVTL